MGKPINFNDENCESKSSNCVIWAGPDIPCIDLCQGDSITKVVYDLATKLCTILTQLDVSTYDLKCLSAPDCTILDFKGLMNLLIQKICDLQGKSIAGVADASQGSRSSNSSASVLAQNNDCPNCYVTLAPCFRYPDPGTGDIITESLLQDYVKRIGATLCNLIGELATQTRTVSDLDGRVKKLEAKKDPVFTIPELYPTCIADPNELLTIDQFAQILEQQFCTLLQSVGSSADVYNSIAATPSDFNNAKALGTGGGIMGSLPGWIMDPKNLSETVVNVWKTLGDLRSAVRNIQINCCNPTCDGIELQFNATLESKVLKLFFDGTIPGNLDSCVAGGSTFKVQDNSGNSFTTIVDIKGNMNNISGVSIDLTSTSLNFADDLKVTSIFCFSDAATGSMCQNYLEKIVNNNLNCPVINIIATGTTLSYEFTHNSGVLVYSIQLFNSSNTMVQSVNVGVNGPTVVSGTFSSLDYNTAYRMRVQMITANNTKTCPFTAVNTLPNPCPAPTGVSAIIVY